MRRIGRRSWSRISIRRFSRIGVGLGVGAGVGLSVGAGVGSRVGTLVGLSYVRDDAHNVVIFYDRYIQACAWRQNIIILICIFQADEK